MRFMFRIAWPDAPFTILSMAEMTTTRFVDASRSMNRSQKFVPRTDPSDGTLNRMNGLLA